MQRKVISLVEAVINTTVGFGIAMTSQVIVLPLFGLEAPMATYFWITVIFTVISVARQYVLRRLFNWLHLTQRLR